MVRAPKTVLCLHSLPCFGRSGLAVTVPVLAALGTQAVPLPTALLSTHTGGLGAPARCDATPFSAAALAHYRRLGLQFDAVYTGYLADAAQAQLALQALEMWPDALKVVDPVLGDGGHMYRSLTPDLVPAMADLCTREQAANLAQRLCRLCPQVLVTGVADADGRTVSCAGAVRGGPGYTVKTALLPRMFHGTGDIFAAAMVGRLLQGNVTEAAAQAAAAFVGDCIRLTPAGTDERLGVWLENALPALLLGRGDGESD